MCRMQMFQYVILVIVILMRYLQDGTMRGCTSWSVHSLENDTHDGFPVGEQDCSTTGCEPPSYLSWADVIMSDLGSIGHFGSHQEERGNIREVHIGSYCVFVYRVELGRIGDAVNA